MSKEKNSPKIEIRNSELFGSKNAFKSFEPKVQNRFILKFKDNFTELSPWTVKETQRPSYNRDAPSKWNDITIVFYDPISPSNTQIIVDNIRTFEGQNKPIPVNYTLQMLGPIGDVVEEWNISGELMDANFGELKYDAIGSKKDTVSKKCYGNPRSVEITLRIKIEEAILAY